MLAGNPFTVTYTHGKPHILYSKLPADIAQTKKRIDSGAQSHADEVDCRRRHRLPSPSLQLPPMVSRILCARALVASMATTRRLRCDRTIRVNASPPLLHSEIARARPLSPHPGDLHFSANTTRTHARHAFRQHTYAPLVCARAQCMLPNIHTSARRSIAAAATWTYHQAHV